MIKTDIHQLIEPVLTDLGYQLWGIEYFAQGKHSLLRVYIDKSDGIHIEDCETASRSISALLDVNDPIPGNYSLEVSSPGLDRPLFTARHFQQFIGAKAQVKLNKPVDGSRKLNGFIRTADDDSIKLEVGNKEYMILFSQIVKANLTGE